LADFIDASPISRMSKQVHFVHSIITAAEQVSSRKVKHISEQIFALFAKFAISNSSHFLQLPDILPPSSTFEIARFPRLH
jgi:hypothetical protein